MWNPKTFYGQTYLYPTPNNGLVEIGVTTGLGGTWIVGWFKPSGATKRVVTKNLPPSDDPEGLQMLLDQFSEQRQLHPKAI